MKVITQHFKKYWRGAFKDGGRCFKEMAKQCNNHTTPVDIDDVDKSIDGNRDKYNPTEYRENSNKNAHEDCPLTLTVMQW